MEWVNPRQITDEQKVVLKTLAESVGKPSLKFLEVGNWLGESTLVLAEVAKKHFGKLYCVDWWKGNVGTELETIASKEDIFTLFWQRICQEGFEDVVVTIRGSSDAAAEILRDQTFDLIFIDGDHRYQAVCLDLKFYEPKLAPWGILLGHDYLHIPGVEKAVKEFAEDRSGKYRLQIFEHDCGLFVLWPLTITESSRMLRPVH